MLEKFAFARYRLTLRVTSPLRLSDFAGATLRGGFGHIFKKSVCTWLPADCPRCALKHACAYPYIFETAPPPGAQKLRGLDQVPRPYVIEPPEESARWYRIGQQLIFHLLLVGRGIDYLPHFVLAFRDLGRVGLGAERGRYEIAEIHAEIARDWRRIYESNRDRLDAIPPAPKHEELCLRAQEMATYGSRLAVEFLTPTRIQSEGRMQAEVTFSDLTRALLRRLSSLCYFHCGQELEADFKGLIEQAARVRTLESRLSWQAQ